MGWFDEQIKERKQNDNEVFAETFMHIAGAVMGKKPQKRLMMTVPLRKMRLMKF